MHYHVLNPKQWEPLANNYLSDFEHSGITKDIYGRTPENSGKDQIFSKETVFVERKNEPQRPPRDPIQSAKTIYTISMRKNSENRSDLSKNESSVRSKSPYSTFKSLKEEQNRYFSSVKKVDSPLNQSTSTQKPSFDTL